MSVAEHEADYVIVGAGACGMAFADALLAESPGASIIIVDRRHKPGGHWNDSYPFVRLHGPSANYGVNSRPFGDASCDAVGLNRGLQRLASGAEICAYFDAVMQQHLLPSGRVRYLPMSELEPGGVARSLVTGRRMQLRARRKWVDATVADTQVPATHDPAFTVAGGVAWTTPDRLVHWREPVAGYVIVGGGKTAMDTALWLLEQGVAPQRLTWVRPRESWLLNRANLQVGNAFFAPTFSAAAAELEAAQQAASVPELFARLEAQRLLQRMDRGVAPTMFRCAIVSDAELAQLRRIGNVVRLGHVLAVERGRIVLAHGEVPMAPGRLYIHCSSAGLPRAPAQPVFQRGRIVLQYVRRCAPCFSAALIARLEATLDDDAAKNALCLPVAPPNEPLDWLRMHVRTARNQQAWSRVPGLQDWLCRARLDVQSGMFAHATQQDDAATQALLARYRQARRAGLERMEELLAQAGG